MSEKKFQRFGKYLILDHLVDGGMAKICRARYLGEQANKVVAIKMVQPQFSNDEAFVRMFQDELNITFGMLHPNIMQVYDYGKTNGQLYTAMEYIHGANLKQYLDRLKERKVVFPVQISCYIISQVCLGLHYAHTFTDKLTGKPYNIVHRDISPHNIMLTYDGAVKVIDFGIAKANTNSESTQAGTIKGKLSYLAPEYLDGMELDARYDEFAVGITLWELLCSRKLFQAGNDLAVLKQIQACKIVPPSQINPSVPKELDAIVMKALSKDRNQRYENLDQMNRALVRFLYSNFPEFNASDLKGFANDLFKVEIESDRERFVDYGRIDVQAYVEDLKKEESRTGKIKHEKVEAQAQQEEGRKKIREIELAIDAVGAPTIVIEKKLEKTGSRNVKQLPNAGNQPNRKTTFTMSTHKKIEKDRTGNSTEKERVEEAKGSSSSKVIIMIVAASLAAVSYFQADLVEGFTGFNLKKMIHGENSGRTISSVDKPKKNTPVEIKNTTGANGPTITGDGKVILRGADISMDIIINGEKRDWVGAAISVPLDTPLSVIIKKAGFIPFVSENFTITKETGSKVISIPKLEKAKRGVLSTSMNYPAGSKLVYEESGELVERELPFKDVPVAEGTYLGKVVNPILNTEKKVEFKIEENKKHFLE